MSSQSFLNVKVGLFSGITVERPGNPLSNRRRKAGNLIPVFIRRAGKG